MWMRVDLAMAASQHGKRAAALALLIGVVVVTTSVAIAVYPGSTPETYRAVRRGLRMDAIANAVIWIHVKSGRVRALAVTGPRRSPEFPDVPTIADARRHRASRTSQSSSPALNRRPVFTPRGEGSEIPIGARRPV